MSVMFANNETGVLQPIAEVVRIARSAGALVHCDAVQAAGKVPVDLHGLGVDYLSLVRPQARRPDRRRRVGRAGRCAVCRRPHRRRAGNQSSRRHGERRRHRGLWRAAEAARDGLDAALRDRVEAALLAIAPKARVYGAAAPRLPNTTCISMPGVKAETQVMALDLAGVCVSAGAACSSGKVTPLGGAVGHGHRACRGRDSAIRISFGWNTRFRGY